MNHPEAVLPQRNEMGSLSLKLEPWAEPVGPAMYPKPGSPRAQEPRGRAAPRPTHTHRQALSQSALVPQTARQPSCVAPGGLSPHTPGNHVCTSGRIPRFRTVSSVHLLWTMAQGKRWAHSGWNRPRHPGPWWHWPIPALQCCTPPALLRAVSTSCLKVWAGGAWLLRRPQLCKLGLAVRKQEAALHCSSKSVPISTSFTSSFWFVF